MTDLLFSPVETARFGLRVHRASVDAIDADALAEAIERERVDIAIVRVPARALASLEDVRRKGLTPIVADTLVRYEIDLATFAPMDRTAGATTLRAATRDDADLLEAMAREIFAGYTSHYHANPLLPPAKILDGYAQWAASHARGDDDAAAWIVESDGKVAAFSCYRIDGNSGLATGILNGVLPAARGAGVYRGMLQEMLNRFAAIGMRRFAIATQVHNIAVQRVWARMGLALELASNTLHINALRGDGFARLAGETPAAMRDAPQSASSHHTELAR